MAPSTPCLQGRRTTRAAGGRSRARRRMLPAPMSGDVASGAEPDFVARARMIEELDESDRLRWPADQPVMQRQTHQLRPLRALLVERLEAVDHIVGEFVCGAEACV